MARKWIEFNEPPQFLHDGKYVSLSRDGELVFNAKVYELLGGPEVVSYLYDPTTDCIGLKPVSKGSTNGYKVKAKGRFGSRRVRAGNFIKRHEIRYGTTVQFLDISIEDGVLVLNLMKTRKVIRVQRRDGKRYANK